VVSSDRPGIYRKAVNLIKRLDQLTGNRVGDLARALTNVNTKKYWDRYLNSRGDFWRDFPYQFLLAELPKNEKVTLLDIGCALGDGCRMLKKNFPLAEITGADLSESGIQKARAKSNDIEYFVFDLYKQEIPKKYDYITLIHILEHFDDPYPIINKCLKAVNRAVYISTPYGGEFDNPRLYWKGEHRYLFNEHTFSKYHGQVLKITDRIEAVGTKHIVYKISP
jgi:2-polyprenyl-3-methyl-5-hydroxy-6-metoxy-1,4-benzoquinol methylase